MTPEARVKNSCTKILKTHNVYYFFPATHGYGKSGGFDIYCSYKGHAIGIECKATARNKPTALQTQNAELAHAFGGMSVLLIHADNVQDLELLLRTLDDENKMYPGKKVWPINSNTPS